MKRPFALTVVAVLVLAACAGPDTGSSAAGPTTTSAASMTEPAMFASEVPGSPAPSTTEPPAADPTTAAQADALLDLALTDVRTGATFTLAELAAAEGPVLLEPMAIWCTNCRAQQQQVSIAHDTGGFTSVSLDVDLSESPDDLAVYADREGFDWRFAMADADLYRLLQERFGVAATNPPSTPLIVIEADRAVRPLAFGQGTRSAEQLLAELGAG